jgi:hypothetical protein
LPRRGPHSSSSTRSLVELDSFVLDVDDFVLDVDDFLLALEDFLLSFDFRELTLESERDARDDRARSVDDRAVERDDRANDADFPEGDVVDKVIELGEKVVELDDKVLSRAWRALGEPRGSLERGSRDDAVEDRVACRPRRVCNGAFADLSAGEILVTLDHADIARHLVAATRLELARSLGANVD